MNLLLDIGGTSTRVSAATGIGELLPVEIFPTERDPESEAARIAHVAKKVLGERKLDRIIAGVAGAIAHDGTVLRSPNLRAYEGKNFAKLLHKELGAEAYLLNDAVLGAFGEAKKGAGKGTRSLLYMTFGTGIGAARVLDGKPDLSIGTETGHQYLIIDGTPTEAEDIISGRALHTLHGKPGEALRDPSVWREAAKNAAIVLHNTILHFVPDKVVIGGSLVKEGSMQVEDIELRLAEIGRNVPRLPRVVRGTLGNSAGLYGAQAYAKMLVDERNRKIKNDHRRKPRT